MKIAANASVDTVVFWNGAGSPTNYAVRVTLSNLSSACGGIGFQDGYRGYVGYVCSNGGWVVVRYDSTGTPTQLDEGSVGQQDSYLVEISVSEGHVDFHIGTTTVFTTPIASGYDTASITLGLIRLYKGQPGQGIFSDFVYGR